MPRPRPWTDEQLIEAVDHSTSYKQVCDHLGIRPGGKTYLSLDAHIARLGIEASHLARNHRQRGTFDRRHDWTHSELIEAVFESRSVSDVARQLGYEPSGGVHRYLKQKFARLGLDTSHFTGQAWARGRTLATKRRRPLSEVLIKGSPLVSNSNLRKRLIEEGVKPAHCEHCARSTWFGQPLPLALDHVNGDHTDNRLENLRILCPNCHAITETWCRKRSRRSPTGERRRN